MQGDPNLNVQHPYMPFPPGASYYSEPRNNHPMASLQGVPLAYGDSFSYHDYSPPLGQTQLGQAFTANAPPYHYFPPVIDPPELTKDNLSTQTLLPESQSQPGSKGRRPCVIPQVTNLLYLDLTSPFVRACAPELEQAYGFSSSELLAFIDGLNEAILPNPALQTTNAVATITSFVPLKSCQIVGGTIGATTGAALISLSIYQTHQYMKKANEEFFGPRGLHAQLHRTKKMLHELGIEDDGDVFAQDHDSGSINGKQDDLSPNTNPIAKRMECLGDRVMELSFANLTEPVAPNNWLKKLGASSANHMGRKQVERMQKKEQKSDKTVSEIEQERYETDAKIDAVSGNMDLLTLRIQNLDPRQPECEKDHKKLCSELKHLRKQLKEAKERRAKVDKKMGKSDKEIQKREAKEARRANRILWIVITPKGETLGKDDEWDSEESYES